MLNAPMVILQNMKGLLSIKALKGHTSYLR